MPENSETAEWVDLPYASARTGFSAVRLLRLIRSGDLPVMQIRGPRRTSHKVPRSLIDEAYAAVMAGGQVELCEFAREWSARNASAFALPSPAVA